MGGGSPAMYGSSRQGHGSPGDELVRADQESAVLVDLADPGPVVVDVGDLAAGADDHGLDRDVQVPADLLGRLRPGLAGDAGEQRERAVGGEVEGGDVARGVADPDMRQVR